jgi:hypothetical protein
MGKSKKQINIIGLKSIEVRIPEDLDDYTHNYVGWLVDNIEQKITRAIGERIAERGEFLISRPPEESQFCPNGCEGHAFDALEAQEHAKVCPRVEEHAREQAARNKRLMKLTNVVWSLLLKCVEPGRCKVNPKFWDELFELPRASESDTYDVVLRLGEEGKLDIFEGAKWPPTMYLRPQTYRCNSCGLLVDGNADPEEHFELCDDRQWWIESMLRCHGAEIYTWYPWTFTYFAGTRLL